jgi:hypothetical protein
LLEVSKDDGESRQIALFWKPNTDM